MIEPLTRLSHRDGQHVICRSGGNFKFYQDSTGAFHDVDIGHVAEESLLSLRAVDMRRRNVVSVGLDGEFSAEKFVGFRPDNCQDGTVQLELDATRFELDGHQQPLVLGKSVKIDDVTRRMGNLYVQSTRQRTRLLVPIAKSCSEFVIQFRVRRTGWDMVRKLGEFWMMRQDGGGLLGRFVQPHLFPAGDLHSPLYSAGSPYVEHVAVEESDDTWIYEKRSTEAFAKAVTDGALKFPLWVDGDIYYSSTNDGRIFKTGAVGGNWADAWSATSGTLRPSDTRTNGGLSGYYYSPTDQFGVQRTVWFPDTTAVVSPVSATHHVHGYGDNELSYCVLCAFTGSNPFIANDFNNWGSASYGLTTAVWDKDGWNVFVMNQDGLAYINRDGTTQLGAREYEHDFLNVEPDGLSTHGQYFTEWTGTDHDPYLDVVEYVPQIFVVC